MPSQPSLILASSSRYRKELLSRLRLPFTAISPDVDETPQPGESPEALVLRLSVAKAMVVASAHPGSIV
ncbi:septum formation inhibitor Maf, partial [Klebsiella pneumoniae]|uniref:Maf family protein n=1 Tax=Klebsiella pneumoniae TaxID=573 RepID=UPI0015F879B8